MEGLMVRLKLQYFSHLMQRADSLEKTLMLGKIEGATEDETVGWHQQCDGHDFEQTLGDSVCKEARCAADHGVTKGRTQLSD